MGGEASDMARGRKRGPTIHYRFGPRPPTMTSQPAPRSLLPDPVPAPPEVPPQPAEGRRSVAFWLYAAHIATLFGLALSNVVLGTTLLASTFHRPLRALRKPRFRPLLTTLGAYAMLLGLSVAASSRPDVSFAHLGELFNLTTLLLCLVLVRGEDAVRLVIDAVLLLATAQALIGLGEVLSLGGADLSSRIHGNLSHYMTFSGILMLADLLLCAELSAGRRIGGWRWLALVPINLALLASLTRSAWVGVAAGFLVLLLLGRRRLRMAAAGAAFAGILLLSQGTVAHRMSSIVELSDPTNYDRLAMAWAGGNMIADRPVLGQGPGMVAERYAIYRHPTAPRYAVPHLHDAFLQVAAERGLPALLSMLALFAVSAGRAFRLFRLGGARRGPRADLYVGILAALGGFLVAGLFEDNWNDTEVQRIVLFLLAAPFCLEEPPGEETD